MDGGSIIWEWGRSIVIGAMGLLLWYFKRTQDAIDKRLDNHENDIEEHGKDMQHLATRTELKELRDATEAKHSMLERDVKNLGQSLSQVVRSEVDTLRQEQQRQNHAVNERLDKLLIIMTKNAGGQ